MITLDEFIESDLSLLAYSDGKCLFESRGSDLIPLLKLLEQKIDSQNGLVLFDRYIGRAAALLMTLIHPTMIYCRIISQGGAEVLHQHNMHFESRQQVAFLMGVTSDEMCRFEKMAHNKNAEELLKALKKKTLNSSQENNDKAPTGDQQ